MKKIATMLLCMLVALVPCLSAVSESVHNGEEIAAKMLGSSKVFKKQAVKGKYKTLKDLGPENEILSVYKNDDGCLIGARIHYGADFYEAPYLDVYVAVDKEGKIAGVQTGESFDHTPQFLDMITPAYLQATYVGQTASPSLIADAVSGATFSSDAVLYAVRLCANYAANVFGWGEKNDVDIQMKKLMAVVPGSYEKAEIDGSFTSAAGKIQYAAQGKTAQGIDFFALVVGSCFVPENADNNMSMPIYQIWIDRATNRAFAANMLAGRFYEGFEMPPEKLAAYFEVVISQGDVFDTYTPGLVTDAPEYVVTSATGSFEDAITGATAQGNDTSLAVRNCFIAAAQYYCACVL